MNGKTYHVKDVARLTGVTVRTLHHYDHLGLLVPSRRTAAGYRIYGEDDLLRLQEILVCRELGLPLAEIQRVLEDEDHDRVRALEEHRARLQERARRMTAMIEAVDEALATLRGEKEMNAEKIFDGFDPSEYEEEVEERWGETDAYRESARRTRSYEKEDWALIQAEHEGLVSALASCREKGMLATDERVLEVAEQMRLHIDRWYYPCSPAQHAALGEMYVADPRFAAHYEKHGEGLAAYLNEAIRENAKRS